MKFIVVALSIAVLGFVSIKLMKYKSLHPFMPFTYNFGKRRDTFKKTLELLDRTKAKVCIETGTSRYGLQNVKGDGAATILFGKWAKQNAAFLHSVDISDESVRCARQEVEKQGLTDHVKVYESDSLIFLRDFIHQVDFLYLDSYDYSDDPVVQAKSQEHHLKEFKAIEDQLHENTIVLIDDCRLPNGGKGKLAVAYMLANGWKMLMNQYQILLVRNDFVY